MPKGLLLLSSGIDSPVAGALMAKRGVSLICIHFDNQPLANEKPLDKVKALVSRLSGIAGKDIRLYVAKHGLSQVEMIRKAERRYQCVLCRRLMLKVAERVALREGCDFIITGESLSQVASQTLKNMSVADKAVKIMILRPLLGFDKGETVRLAREFGTYEISISAGMCCAAVPPNPATRSELAVIENQERLVGMDYLVDNEFKSLEVIG